MEQQLEFTGWVLQVTEKAVLVDVENEAIWIPNSMAEYYGQLPKAKAFGLAKALC